MKKVMIGILILIPIIILLIVLAVGAIVSIDAYFAVEPLDEEEAEKYLAELNENKPEGPEEGWGL